MAARKNAENTRGRPFETGNPGRPKGARNRATIAVQALLDGEAEQISRKCIDLALSGDTTALRLCMERILPPVRERAISFPLPKIDGIEALPEAQAALLHAVANGQIAPGEARAIGDLVDGYRTAVETTELLQRVVELEKRVGR